MGWLSREVPTALLLLLLLPTVLWSQNRSAEPPGTSVADTSAGARAWIQPGDEVSVRIWNEPEMTGSYRVSDTGEVTLPKLGPVDVRRLTAGALQDSLRRAFAVYLRNPSVDVSVMRRISVVGEVKNPGLYMVDLTVTLREAIARAGGVTEQGNPSRVTLVRGGEEIQLNQRELARYSTMELRSGDQVVIGRRSWFEINSLAVVSTAAVVISVLIPVLQSVL